MTIGIIGRKAGMSRLFMEDGRSVPVTLIEASANRITQIKTEETDGYSAVQVTAGAKRAALISKPLAGHYAPLAGAVLRALDVPLAEGQQAAWPSRERRRANPSPPRLPATPRRLWRMEPN